MELLIWYLPHK